MKESRRDKATRRKRVIAIIVSVVMLLSVCVPLGVMTVYAAPEDERAEDTSNVDYSGDPTVIGDAGVLMESETGKVLFEQNADKQQFPASLTKLITAIVVAEKLKPDMVVKVDDEAANIGGSTMNLRVGEELTVDQLMHGLLIASGNDAAIALAKAVSGSSEEFAKLMNEKALSLGCNSTHFVNPTGLDDDEQYTSARDIATIARAAMKVDAIKEAVSITEYRMPATNMSAERVLKTTNRLLYDTSWVYVYGKRHTIKYEGTIGIKTGTTGRAGYCLVAAAERDGMELISVVMKSGFDLVYADTLELLEHGFYSYSLLEAVKEGQELGGVPAKDGKISTAAAIAESGLYTVVPKGTSSESLEYVLKLPESVQAPVAKGTRLGKATVMLDGTEIGEVNLIAAQSIDKAVIATIWNTGSKILSVAAKILVGIIVVLIIWIVIAVIRSEHRRRGRRRRRSFYGSEYHTTREVSRVKRIK